MTPIQICGYCGSHYTASTCTCEHAKTVRLARNRELEARRLAEREGVANDKLSIHITGLKGKK